MEGHAQPFGGEDLSVDGVVLHGDQAAEQLHPRRHGGTALDLRQGQVLVLATFRLAALVGPQPTPEILLLGDGHAHRQGVDEQPRHVLDAGQIGVAARDHRAEEHLVAIGMAGQHQGPKALDQAGQGDPLPFRRRHQPGRHAGLQTQGLPAEPAGANGAVPLFGQGRRFLEPR